ncbi:putative bifunctional diguanylate cyclase/phosphodiesterase [Hoeflea marina]|uniref:putative bifunctional diguanylate cyclase/phosphodiesterase n=1 Tax=Hoeflea marina TaxID=274592 RepID=UPI001304FD26|nr:bifunctional diguanylate cyclase/phosphodiesterase [Hoeflea marina]
MSFSLRREREAIEVRRKRKAGVEALFGALILGVIATAAVLEAVRWKFGPGLEGNGWLFPAGSIALATSFAAYGGIWLAFSRRIDTLRKMHTEAVALSQRDSLTGTYMRDHFVRKLKAELSEAGRFGHAALLVFDIDHFKQFNDTHGHSFGDQVLQFFTASVREALPGATIGRLGGDEFALFLRHSDPLTRTYLDSACQTLLALLASGLAVGPRRLAITASIGIALAPEHGKSCATLMSKADMAMYLSKKNGRACWTYFDETMLTDARNERALERELRAAILLGHFRIAYQPIVDGKGEVVAMEALLRWQHQLRGTIAPDVFIPIAEQSSLIHDLGLMVLEMVCRDMPLLPAVPINVNISAKQLRLPDLLAQYLAILATHGIDPSQIVIEITESASLTANAKIIAAITAIRAAGFKVALDDFGMGYSEFNQLRHLPYDTIKIDKSYIRNLGQDAVTDIFVNAVVEIARTFGKSVVAEGIESEDDRIRAGIAGCTCFQGYHYGRPAFLEAGPMSLAMIAAEPGAERLLA